MKIRVLKVAAPMHKTDVPRYKIWGWRLCPEGLDDLELYAFKPFFVGNCDRESAEPFFHQKKEGAEELARRLGHELVFDQHMTEFRSPEAEKFGAELQRRDRMSCLDRGSPEYAKTG